MMRDEFKVHLLNETGMAKATAISEIFSEALGRLDARIPVGRERSLMVTKLQEAAFWAKRAIAVDPNNCQSTDADG